MDAQDLSTQVDDLVRSLTSPQQSQQHNAVRQFFAPDAVLDTPFTTAKGVTDIRALSDLRAAFQKDSKVTVSKIKWDDKHKTASFSVKARYALPLAQAPWPFSLGRHLSATIPSDVKLYVTPDDDHPVRADATEATRYHVSKVETRIPTPRSGLIAAAFSAVLFVVRIVAPYVIGVLVVLNKFFQRHPLQQGYFRTGIAAAHELVVWVLQFIRSQLPFVKSKGRKKTGYERGGRRSDATTDSEREDATTTALDRAASAVRNSRPVKAAQAGVKAARDTATEAAKAVEDTVKAAKTSAPVKEAAREAEEVSNAAKEAVKSVAESQPSSWKPEEVVEAVLDSKFAQQASRRASDAFEAVKEVVPVQEATKAVEAVSGEVSEVVEAVLDSKAAQEAARRAEEVVEVVKDAIPAALGSDKPKQETKTKEVKQNGQKPKQDAPKVEKPKQDAPKVEKPKQDAPKVEKPKQEQTPKQEHKPQNAEHKHKKDHQQKKEHKHTDKEHKPQHQQPKHTEPEHAPTPIPLKKLDAPTAAAVKAHDAPAPVAPSPPEHDTTHPSFADIASHQPANHATDERTAAAEFPALGGNGSAVQKPAPAKGEEFPTLGHPEVHVVETSPEHPSFADVAAEPAEHVGASETSSATSTAEDKEGEKPKTAGGKKKKGKKGRKH